MNISCRYYYFDSTKSPAFEICYVLTALSTISVLIILLTVDLLYFGISLYTVAMYDELDYMISLIDRRPIIWRRTLILQSIKFHVNLLGYESLPLLCIWIK